MWLVMARLFLQASLCHGASGFLRTSSLSKPCGFLSSRRATKLDTRAALGRRSKRAAPLRSSEAASTTGGNPKTQVATTESVDWASATYVPDGILAVYKPRGWTSSDVVGKIRGMLSATLRQRGVTSKDKHHPNRKRVRVKVGHGGTLDPLATGVLVIGIGKGCRRLEGYLAGMKRYRGIGLLGRATDTLDCEGKVVHEAPWRHVSYRALAAATPDFTGEISQVPPMYSALQQGGRRLYDLAREGITVEREARRVNVTLLQILTTQAEWDAAAAALPKRRPIATPPALPEVRAGGAASSQVPTPALPASVAEAVAEAVSGAELSFPHVVTDCRGEARKDKGGGEGGAGAAALPEGFPAAADPADPARLPGLPYFALDVECGGGTYVRSLIADLAAHQAVESAAHMVWLERTVNGPFALADCLPPSQWAFEALCEHAVSCTALADAAAADAAAADAAAADAELGTEGEGEVK